MNVCRTLLVEMNRHCYKIASDSSGHDALLGSEHESFEELVKAVMGGPEFSNHLMKLVADKLS